MTVYYLVGVWIGCLFATCFRFVCVYGWCFGFGFRFLVVLVNCCLGYLYLLGWILPLGAGFEVACVYVDCGVLVIWVVMIVGCGLIWLFVGVWVIGCLVV